MSRRYHGAVNVLIIVISCALLLGTFTAFYIVLNDFNSDCLHDSEYESPSTPSDTVIRDENWYGIRKGSCVGGKLYDEPDGELLAELESGIELIVMQRKDEWLHCRIGTKTAWIRAASVILEDEYTEKDGYTAEPTELDEAAKHALDEMLDQYGAQSATVCVIDDGQLKYSYAYGYMDFRNEQPCSVDTKYRSASISKVIVAMCAMSMQEQGLVSLDDDFGDYLGAKLRNPNYRNTPISFRMLLTHTSTLNSLIMGGTGRDVLIYRLRGSGVWGSSHVPGTADAFYYSNAGIASCSAALECVCGQTLVEYSREYFFNPLGADASLHARFIENKELISPCYYGRGLAASVSEFMQRAYSETAGDNFYIYPGGLLISSVDLAKLCCILINDGYYGGVYYLSEDSVAEMETVHFETENFNQCIVLRQRDELLDGRDMYYHTGLAYGVHALVAYEKESGDGIAVIVTGSDIIEVYDSGVAYVCNDLAEYCLANLC